jgi:hypothetical protein
VRKRSVELLMTSNATTQLEASIDRGAGDAWTVFIGVTNGQRTLFATSSSATPLIPITPLDQSATITGRWLSGAFLFVHSERSTHLLRRWVPSMPVQTLAVLPSGAKHGIEAMGNVIPILSLDTGVFIFNDGGVRAIDQRADVVGIAPWNGVASAPLAYVVADGGVYLGDAFGSVVASNLSATALDVNLADTLLLQRSPTELWIDARGVAYLYLRAPQPIVAFEFEEGRTLVQVRCDARVATLLVDGTTGATTWLSEGEAGWPFDTGDLGEGPNLQAVAPGEGFVVRPDRL